MEPGGGGRDGGGGSRALGTYSLPPPTLYPPSPSVCTPYPIPLQYFTEARRNGNLTTEAVEFLLDE